MTSGPDGQVLLAALLGAGTGLGLLLMLLGVRGPDADAPGTETRGDGAPLRGVRRPWVGWAGAPGAPGRVPWRRVAACAAVAAGVAVATRWPVAAVLAACAAWCLPALVGPDHAHRRRVARIEAVATWTESLRDTLSAAAGLEQALLATTTMAPAPIRAEVAALAARLRRGDRLGDALRAFAADLDDATGDLVVTALVLAAERNARHLADLLGLLATAAREQASLRLQTAAGRAHIRTSTRIITAVTLAMAAGLVLLNRGYLTPYDTPLGQLVLAVVGGAFAAAFTWLGAIAKVSEPPRILAAPVRVPARPARGAGAPFGAEDRR